MFTFIEIVKGTVKFLESLDFGDILGIISIILGMISIGISFLIYQMTLKTSQKVLEDSLSRAFEKITITKSVDESANGGKSLSKQNKIINTGVKILHDLSSESKKELIVKLKSLMKKNKNKFSNIISIRPISIVVGLKNILDEDKVAILLLSWREKGYISWKGNLEVSTSITIDKETKIIEDISSC